VLAELGRGGMGVVFRGEDPRLGRQVALKVMRPDLAIDPDQRERFLREARAAAALRDEHIVGIHHVDCEADAPFLVMELLEGESLDACLRRRGQLPTEQALSIGRDIALGLAAAHAAGLIHRDIKPANVFLVQSDAQASRIPVAKLLDFGLARSLTGSPNLTRPGAVIGTPAYMAPEQARGEPVDERSDLFSLGAVLYQMTTGLRPFPGHDIHSVLSAVAAAAPTPPRDINPDLPPALSDLILRLLTSDPQRRPTSARDVVNVLSAVASPVVVVRPTSSRRRVATLALLTPVLVLALFALARFWPHAQPGDGEVADADRSAAEWLLQRHAQLQIVDHGMLRSLQADHDVHVHDGPIRIVGVSLAHQTDLTDADLEHLSRLIDLQSLDLSGTPIGNAALAHVRGLTALVRLNLHGTQIDDTGLENLRTLAALRELDLSGTRISNQGLAALGRLRALRTLNLAGTGISGPLDHLKALAELRELQLQDTRIRDDTLHDLWALPHLGALDLGGTAITDAGAKDLAGLSGLRVLDLHGTRVSAAGAAKLRIALPHCQVALPTSGDGDRLTAVWAIQRGGKVRIQRGAGLTVIARVEDVPPSPFAIDTLDLSGCPIRDEELRHLDDLADIRGLNLSATAITPAGLSRLRSIRSLTSLALGGRLIGDAALNVVADLTTLQTLSVEGTFISDAGLKKLGRLNHLQVLDLSGTPITDAGLAHLAPLADLQSLTLTDTQVGGSGLVGLRSLKHLQKLVLARTPIQDSSVTHIAALPSVTDLDLSATSLTDAGLAHLKGMTRLQSLRLKKTAVTDNGLLVLTNLRELQFLDLTESSVTNAGLGRLRTLCPRCRIEW
jgi:Leucine-rich repeat (LRR) protein